MKKVFTLLLCMILAPWAMAQSSMDNLQMENWTTTALGDPTPTGFFSIGAAENTSDPQQGTSALKVTTEYSATLTDTGGFSVTGAVGATGLETGQQYSMRPDSATGYLRFQIPEKDTGVFLIQLTRYDQTNGTQVVGQAVTLLTDTISTWTPVTLPFQYNSCMAPDSATVIIASEGNFLFGFGSSTIGGVAEADNFQLHFPTAPVLDSTSVTDVSCPGAADGGITSYATSNDTCTMYKLDGGNYQSSNSFNNLSGGTYDVIVSNGGGYDTAYSVVVDTIGNAMSMAVSDTDSVDISVDGTVNFDGSGSTGSSYTWDFGDTSSTQSGVSVSHTYTSTGTYWATLTVSDGSCTDVDSVKITVVNSTAILEDGKDPVKVNIYPNPARELVNLQWSAPADGLLQVTDLQGRTVIEEELNRENKIELDLSSFEKGAYLIRYTGEKGVFSEQLIVE